MTEKKPAKKKPAAITTVYGASDDLIELEGGISDEFYYRSGDEFLAFDEGTVLAITYDDDGIWRLRVARAGTATVEIVRCESDDLDVDYSDRATLTGVMRVTHLTEWNEDRCTDLFQFMKLAEGAEVECTVEEPGDGPSTLKLSIRGTNITFENMVDASLIWELVQEIAKGHRATCFLLTP